MRCPKCGLNSFDHNLVCPKCRKDLTATRRLLNLTMPSPGDTDFFTLAGQRVAVPQPFLGEQGFPGGLPQAVGGEQFITPDATILPDRFEEILPTTLLEEVDEITPLDEISPLDEIGPLEEITPLAEMTTLEEIGPLDKISALEEISPLGEIRSPGAAGAFDEIDPVDDIIQVEDIGPLEDIIPVDDIGPIAEDGFDDIEPDFDSGLTAQTFSQARPPQAEPGAMETFAPAVDEEIEIEIDEVEMVEPEPIAPPAAQTAMNQIKSALTQTGDLNAGEVTLEIPEEYSLDEEEPDLVVVPEPSAESTQISVSPFETGGDIFGTKLEEESSPLGTVDLGTSESVSFTGGRGQNEEDSLEADFEDVSLDTTDDPLPGVSEDVLEAEFDDEPPMELEPDTPPQAAVFPEARPVMPTGNPAALAADATLTNPVVPEPAALSDDLSDLVDDLNLDDLNDEDLLK